MKKPWVRSKASPSVPHALASKEDATTPVAFWFQAMRDLKGELDIRNVDLETLDLGPAPFGKIVSSSMMEKSAQERGRLKTAKSG
jgi:hypothetical protein